jgi:pyrimidine-nucleoside phosphorylase
MNVVELIKKKRDGISLSDNEIKFLIRGVTRQTIPNYQFSAFLMAGYLNGFNKSETRSLTDAMLYSGKVIDLKKIKGIKIDKHSTGGVGDKTSLILAPIVAAAGVKVPMISGRGLGHSGGTLDKLESIPGFRTNLSLAEYKSVLKKCGAVMIGQTKEIAPADKIIYSLRDVTATVESIPLITASIMSKKLAEGIDGLVLDIKTGNGAFMKSVDDSLALANSLISTAKLFDKKVIGFITDMNQPLGNYVGNWFEVFESIKVLQGENVADLLEVTLNLSGAMIYLGGLASSIEEGIEISKKMIKSGKAFDKFMEIVKNQNGDISVLKNPNKYPKSKFTETVSANKNGFVTGINTYEIGMCSLELGAGRKTVADKIDFKAGMILRKKIGDSVKYGETLLEFHTDKKEVIDLIKERLKNVIQIGKAKTKAPKLIRKILK